MMPAKLTWLSFLQLSAAGRRRQASFLILLALVLCIMFGMRALMPAAPRRLALLV